MVAITFSISSAVFLITATFIFIFGLNDFLTYTTGESWVKPTFTQQYAWLIETTIFSLIGAALLYRSEKIRSKEKGKHFPDMHVEIVREYESTQKEKGFLTGEISALLFFTIQIK